MSLSYINILAQGELALNDKESFTFNSMTVIDKYGNEHVLTWKQCVIDTKVGNVLIGGDIHENMLEIRFVDILVDGEPFEGMLERVSPFLIKHVDYSYKGDREDDVWFAFFKMNTVDMYQHYLMENTESLYCSSWDTTKLEDKE